MVGRNPARFLAPIALIAFAFALYSVLSGENPPAGEDSGNRTSQEATPTATETPEKEEASTSKKRKTYTVKSGDTASGIAEANGIDLETLAELNQDLDLGALSPGQKIRLEE
ncbi:LysM domain-containing protein [Solirubrobacter phytolaccae]|uniref:LysM domain-containing protein n=1 Tax=Solirubrobacter phytolaccae TaxID=1404360 RepID=A0A9X3NDL5_9ACTN|nr:LysM domain-containing protein [Solirubrobacter phytolaccae]MDA0180282.1 LysM domain-containing protein [Solirubrobacter phytolaccae]